MSRFFIQTKEFGGESYVHLTDILFVEAEIARLFRIAIAASVLKDVVSLEGNRPDPSLQRLINAVSAWEDPSREENL